MPKVLIATPYQHGEGRAEYMLLNQHQFPLDYSDQDRLWSVDHDRMLDRNYHEFRRLMTEQYGGGELSLGQYFRNCTPKFGLEFMVKLFEKVCNTPCREATGWRVLETTHRQNGYPVFSLELFQKVSPDTEVFDGDDAPNVEKWKETKFTRFGYTTYYESGRVHEE